MSWPFSAGKARRVAQQAAAWRAEMQEPDSAAHIAAFEQWLKADPAHLQAYRDFDAIAGLGARISSATGQRQPTAHRATALTAAAMALLLGVGVGSWWLVQEQSPAFTAIRNTTPAVRSFRLADGSLVALDTGASVSVPRDGRRAELHIEAGRVRILARHGDGRSLKVIAPGGDVVASNSLFDLVVRKDQSDLFALAGDPLQIALAHNAGASSTLPSSASLRFSDGRAADGVVDRTWPDARVAFQRARLGQVIARANRDANPKLLADEVTSALLVSGVLDLRDTRALARKLAAALDLSVEDRGPALLLRRRK